MEALQLESVPNLFGYRKFWAERLTPAPFLPMSAEEMDALGWDRCDVILVTGDAYVDHPSFGMAIIGFATGKLGLFDEGVSKGISAFVFKLAIPVMLFHTLGRLTFPEIEWRGLLVYYLATGSVEITNGDDYDVSGVVPDVLCLAKSFGGGMPLGAFIASRELMQNLTHHPPLGHITTFGGHPVSCAAAR